MTTREKLEALFSEENFFVNNSNKGSFEDILDTVHEKYPEITETELDEFLEEICDIMHDMEKSELKEGDLDQVSGGGVTVMTCLVIGAGALAGHLAGNMIGEAIYYYNDNRKKKKKK